jgi:hypothetical protein
MRPFWESRTKAIEPLLVKATEPEPFGFALLVGTELVSTGEFGPLVARALMSKRLTV